MSEIKKILIKCYEYLYEKKRLFKLHYNYRLKIMSPDKTLAYIKKCKCSIARFGDGEFDLIFEKRDLKFQNKSLDIKNRLANVLKNRSENLLLCVPRCINTTKECGKHAETFWVEWAKNGHHEEIVELLHSCSGKGYVYGDAQITRPYIDWKTSKRANRLFPKLKSLWENEDIIIVEGDQTRLGIGNDLFSKANSVKRILTPAIGAFELYDDIKKTILDNYNGELIIMAIGPTATILASEFSNINIQALDIGNIDIEYEWYLMGATERVPIPGKFTNEAKNGSGRVFTECKDPTYLSQIIAKVGC